MSKVRFLQNAIITPDGTVLVSRTKYEKKEHKDTQTGKLYFVEGGVTGNVRRSNHSDEIDLTLTEDSSIKDFKNRLLWATFDRDKTKNSIKFIFIKEMSIDHLRNTLKTNSELPYTSQFAMRYVLSEKLYSKKATEDESKSTKKMVYSTSN